ncbi:MAG: DUF5696 domain-containing protein [Treponema sp.]|nr:DUF5696 domain-containing protein [Treponema sp.]
MEKMKKENKAPKEKKAKKGMPEGYIGRPKPMKTKKFEFHKPTVGFYIGLVFFLALAGLVTYVGIRLANVGNVKERDFEFYEYEAEKQPESYVLENDYLKFELDPVTTQFSVTKKSTGVVWYSNDPESDNDAISLPKEKNNMKSPFFVKYSTENGVDDVYDVYTNSVKRQFYNVSGDKNTVTVNYTVGQMDREYTMPLAIYADEMDAYLEKMAKSDQNKILRYYKQIVYDELDAAAQEEMLEKYEDLKSQDIYLARDSNKAFEKEKAEEIFEKAGYTYDEYLVHKAIYKESNIKDVPQFDLTVTYKLDKDSLIVDIPFDKISYKSIYPITQVSILPYFGSSSINDNGFMFVPEGGGSLINFNNGKTKQNAYYSDVYGWDYATDRKAVIKETKSAYPVFGMSYTDKDASFISIIEKGSEYASITAEISGKLANYNYVRAEYKMLHREQFEVSTRNTSAQYSYEQTLPAGESLVQVYKFIDSSSYVDMAKAYREYLFGSSAKKTNNQEVPLVMEIVGAVDKVQQVLGMPKTLPYKLTSYSEATDIINDIEDSGIKNVNYKLSGFINNGVRQTILTKFKFISTLGGKSGFNKLVSSVSDTSAKLYLDGITQYANQVSNGGGFNRFSTPARLASSEIVKLYKFSPVWYGKLEETDPYYLIRPDLTEKACDVFLQNGQKYNLFGLSYNDIGSELSGDYNQHNTVSRASSCEKQVAKINEAKDAGMGIMINAGNAYAIKQADMVTNMLLRGSDYAIIDKQVPFYQIALHGYINYTGSPINLGYENNQIILEDAESGAGLYYVVMKENEKILQETSYTEYFAACYDSWKDRIVSTYERYNKEMGKVINSTISDHDYLTKDVTVTSYDNGYKVFVNYGYVDYTTDSGDVIPARDYKVLKEEK